MENMIEAMEWHIVRIAIKKEADVKGSGNIFGVIKLRRKRGFISVAVTKTETGK